ncbi:MAG: hypothetical protein ACKV0T_13990 [Planctomycetales bacterium]
MEQTDGMSFAEMEEIKKLLVLRQLDTGRWDWEGAWDAYMLGRGKERARPKIGFSAPLPRHRSGAPTISCSSG